MAIGVVDGLRLAEVACLHRIAHRRMGDRGQLDLAPLADDQRHRVADVVGPDHVPVDLHHRQGGRRPHAQVGHPLVRPLDPVEDRGPEVHPGGPRFLDHAVGEGSQGQLGRLRPRGLAAQTVRHGQHRPIRVHRNDHRGVLVARVAVGRGGRVDRHLAPAQLIVLGRRHIPPNGEPDVGCGAQRHGRSTIIETTKLSDQDTGDGTVRRGLNQSSPPAGARTTPAAPQARRCVSRRRRRTPPARSPPAPTGPRGRATERCTPRERAC